MSYSCMPSLHLLFIFSWGNAGRPPSTRRCVLIIDVLSGQDDPDVLRKLEKLFCFLFLNSDCKNPQSKLAIRGTVSGVQLAS